MFSNSFDFFYPIVNARMGGLLKQDCAFFACERTASFWALAVVFAGAASKCLMRFSDVCRESQSFWYTKSKRFCSSGLDYSGLLYRFSGTETFYVDSFPPSIGMCEKALDKLSIWNRDGVTPSLFRTRNWFFDESFRPRVRFLRANC